MVFSVTLNAELHVNHSILLVQPTAWLIFVLPIILQQFQEFKGEMQPGRHHG